MQPFPHEYRVHVEGERDDPLSLTAENLPPLQIAPPREFDGPGDHWSPEQLLIAAVANCLVLSFRAVAGAAQLDWESITCDCHGTLNKVDRQLRFTQITSTLRLVISSTEDREKAARMLERAEQTCLVSNSLNAEKHLQYEIISA